MFTMAIRYGTLFEANVTDERLDTITQILGKRAVHSLEIPTAQVFHLQWLRLYILNN